ncbi:hypothetical protein [Haloarcula salina]|uniref:Uncharacterized protein n=1 Tax=Haloarcula salina TaxID=1429914 RepID=A0AA41KJB8_9EURY|nr:hypothetical protein [Haloarcula salina]MBV0900729.1 hypothetical protein [Haloarcula salina]
MSADKQDSRRELGFSVRRFVLLVVLLIASRGAVAFVFNGNRLAGVLVVILVSILVGWLFLRYEDSRSGE